MLAPKNQTPIEVIVPNTDLPCFVKPQRLRENRRGSGNAEFGVTGLLDLIERSSADSVSLWFHLFENRG